MLPHPAVYAQFAYQPNSNACMCPLQRHVMVPFYGTDSDMKRKHQKTLGLIFRRPVSGNVKWVDVKGLLKELGAELEEREGSRVVVFLFGEVRVYHRPHPSPSTDKGAVASVRDWLKANGVTP